MHLHKELKRKIIEHDLTMRLFTLRLPQPFVYRFLHVCNSCFFTGYFQILNGPTCMKGTASMDQLKVIALFQLRELLLQTFQLEQRYLHNILTTTTYWTQSIAQECCEKVNNGCYEPYQPVATDRYPFHGNCIGLYLPCSGSYLSETIYMEIEYLCIDGKISNYK